MAASEARKSRKPKRLEGKGTADAAGLGAGGLGAKGQGERSEEGAGDATLGRRVAGAMEVERGDGIEEAARALLRMGVKTGSGWKVSRIYGRLTLLRGGATGWCTGGKGAAALRCSQKAP